MVPLCLERAGAVLLDVDITVSDVKSEGNFLEPLLSHISKVNRLRLVGYSTIEVVASDLPGFFTSPMPNLSSLELQQDTEPAELFPLNETPIPPIFQKVSKLKSLRLTRIPIYPTLFSITSLKELKLLGYANPFNFRTFIGFLGSNLDLELIELDIQFVADSVETGTARNVPLSRLQHLSITCSKAIDSKGLLSCISLPRGVHIEVTSTHTDPDTLLGSFLPSSLTPIHDLLAPITTIKTQLDPQEFQVFGNGSSYTFRGTRLLLNVKSEFGLFPTTPVRELYINTRPYKLDIKYLSNTIKVLPVLEILAISGAATFPVGLFSALTEKPVSCPALKTIAFFDCEIGPDVMKKLGEALEKRRDSTAARVYRVVIVSSTGTMPDCTSVQQLRKTVPCVDIRMDDKLPDLW